MGGYLSGRYRTRTAGNVEGTLRLDIRRLRILGLIRPGSVMAMPLRWTCKGEESGSAAVSVDLSNCEFGGSMRIGYAHNGSSRVDTITLRGVPCRYGGSRFYFVCPITRKPCEVLAFAHGRWASCRAQKLAYASQSEDRLDRLHRAASKAEARLNRADGRRRPRGANRERLLERLVTAQMAADDLFESEAMRRFGRIKLHN